MKPLKSFLSIMLLATPLAAQDVSIPQTLPSPLRQTSDAVQRKVEQPIPQDLPLQRVMKRLDSDALLNGLRPTNGQTAGTPRSFTAGSVEVRIAVLEAKIQALQSELEAQKALLQQLKELVDQQQKKN